MKFQSNISRIDRRIVQPNTFEIKSARIGFFFLPFEPFADLLVDGVAFGPATMTEEVSVVDFRIGGWSTADEHAAGIV